MLETKSIISALAESDEWRLDELWVNPAKGEIAGPGGREQIDPKVMAVLKVLASKPAELVSRNELLEAIWPGGAIYDDVLTQCVYQLRQHLAAAGGGDRFRKLIKTLPKRGYVLKAELRPATSPFHSPGAVTESTNPVAETNASFFSRHRAQWLALVLVVLTVSWVAYRQTGPHWGNADPAELALTNHTIVVLPFANHSGNAPDNYLSEGVGDELRDRIAANLSLRVVARRSSIALRDSQKDVREIGRMLGVGRIIEGRFNREQGRIVVTVELVDASSGFQLWSQTYDRSSQDLMLIQRSLAHDVMQQLLPDWQGEAEEGAPSSQQLAAHDLILLGRQFEQQLTDEQRVDETILAKAIDLYRQAVATDPGSAEAAARLGAMLLYQGSIPEAEPFILKALELDPGRAETFTALGTYYWAIRSVGIGGAYRRALELNPNDADANGHYASWSWLQGSTGDAVSHYQIALDVDPLNLLRYRDLGYMLAFGGDRDRALQVMSRMLELFSNAPAFLAAARISETLGDLDEAIAWAAKAHLLNPDDDEVNGQLAELLARMGDFEAARIFEPESGMGQLFWQGRYQQMVNLGEELVIDQPDDIDLRFLLAFAYDAIGEHNLAIRQLEAAGMPETVLAESRRASETHALNTYIGALQAAGRTEDALSMANWALDFNIRMGRDMNREAWLAKLAQGCAYAVLDNEDAAIDALLEMSRSTALPWLPWLQDLSCFDQFEQDQRYTSIVLAEQDRVAATRQRLPETLARHGLPPISEMGNSKH